mgnify:CR=1 FL=1|jgi:hypothetical protein
MKVIGFRKSQFKGNDGDMVKGMNIFVTYPSEKGEGEECERLYLTEQRLSEIGYKPAVGDEIKPEYNRFGKVSGLELLG